MEEDAEKRSKDISGHLCGGGCLKTLLEHFWTFLWRRMLRNSPRTFLNISVEEDAEKLSEDISGQFCGGGC